MTEQEEFNKFTNYILEMTTYRLEEPWLAGEAYDARLNAIDTDRTALRGAVGELAARIENKYSPTNLVYDDLDQWGDMLFFAFQAVDWIVVAADVMGRFEQAWVQACRDA